MELQIATSLDEVSASEWNQLRGTSNPFLRHEFLAALERHRCIHPGNGWQPFHLLLRRPGGALAAAAPAYIKGHSWGEFVFDFSWANAYARRGLEYYPKLISAVPYSPVSGARVLTAPDMAEADAIATLGAAARRLLEPHGLSSMHWLFPLRDQAERLAAAGYALRVGTQFHWTNPGYPDFEAFLGEMSAKKRKNIRQERRKVHEAGIEFRLLHGPEVSAAQWQVFERFYRDTFHAYGNLPVLNRAFFEDVGERLGEQVLLVLALHHQAPIAGALLLEGGGSLYGRYWGGRENLPGLHFETCYYRPLEYAIARGLQRFEPGAQGEHKIARGFLPTPTYSAHWMQDAEMQRAIAAFTAQERDYVEGYAAELADHGPFRKEHDGG